MASPVATLSPPKTILLAAALASAQDLPRLQHLISLHPTTLAGETLLRILFYLPETLPIATYKPFIDHVLSKTPLPDSEDASPPALDTAPVSSLSEKRARKRVAEKLPPLPDISPGATTDELATSFLTTRAHRIDAETGALSIATQLLALYAPQLPTVATFLTSSLGPLQVLVYDYQRSPVPALSEFCALPADEALEVLIVDAATVVRDLATLVEPYMAPRPREDWKHVWARLGALPFENVVEVVRRWTPPEAVRSEFAGWAMGICYRSEDTSARAWDGMHSIHRRLASIPGATVSSDETLPEKVGDLKDTDNPLFRPTAAGLKYLDVLVTSSAILSRPLKEVACLKLEGTKELQLAVLRQFIRSSPDFTKRTDADWQTLRDGARWLRSKSGVLAQLSPEEIEAPLLAGMLAAQRFGLAKDVYITHQGGLPLADVESCVLVAFSDFFDAASNGNRTRGAMKAAYQSITLLYPHSSTSAPLESAYRLINAVHALSQYSLTLTPGVPLLPARIRAHPDPVSLLARLLNLNRRSYLQPDTLVSIAVDLSPPNSASAAEPRVLGMAANAALAEHDFETAYAYVTTRLLPSATPAPPVRTPSPVVRHRLLHNHPATPILQPSTAEAADVLWRTALAAGRYRPTLGQSGLGQLEKKMELLALAIRFAPKETVAEVLAVWRRAEEEVEALTLAEEQADVAHAARVGAMSGGVTAGRAQAAAAAVVVGRERAYSRSAEEAPQSLFEVARGAARVFGGSRGGGDGVQQGQGRVDGADRGEGYAEERTRKRDVVGGMVTQGLASGLGWVLGAQPAAESK